MNTVAYWIQCAYNVSFMNTVCIVFYEYNVHTSQVLPIQCAHTM